MRNLDALNAFRLVGFEKKYFLPMDTRSNGCFEFPSNDDSRTLRVIAASGDG